MANDGRVDFDPYFIDGSRGRLFTICYRASIDVRPQAVIVVPPFAEEMNKARRQTALAARALAGAGVTTFVTDVHGTGDSDGHFGEASVGCWRDDLAALLAHVRQQGFERISFLAVRSGALLARDFLGHHSFVPASTVLWQPVANGKTMISQFLRLKAAASLVSGGEGASVRELREQIAQGQSVEIAGYELAPALVNEFDGLMLRDLPACGTLHWVNIGRTDDPPSPANKAVLDHLAEREFAVQFQSVDGEPFWSTAEIALAPMAIDATVAAFTS